MKKLVLSMISLITLSPVILQAHTPVTTPYCVNEYQYNSPFTCKIQGTGVVHFNYNFNCTVSGTGNFTPDYQGSDKWSSPQNITNSGDTKIFYHSGSFGAGMIYGYDKNTDLTISCK